MPLRLVYVLAALTVAAPLFAASGPGDPHTLPSPLRVPQLHRAPWLGVEMDAPVGSSHVPVKHVVRGSPADHAGIKDGDEIARVDGAAVATPSDVTRLVSAHSAGDRVDVVVHRGAAPLTINVTLAVRPAPEDILRMEYVGTFAPSLTGLVAATGTVPASINALRGRVAVIEFWATWCGPCRMTMPVLDTWQARYGAQGLSVIGVTTEPPQMAATFATQVGVHYSIASDQQSTMSSAYGVRNIPTVFVIDKRGVVREVSIGYDPGTNSQIELLVQRLLAEPVTLTGATP